MTSCFAGRCFTLSGLALLAGSFLGCDAFEYYGPLPNLRHALTVNLRELGQLESLEIRRKTLSSDASKELRLVNTVNRVVLEDCQVADGGVLLQALGEITRLESLVLRRCNLLDGDLAGLAAAENLRELEIAGTSIDGVGLAALSKLPIRTLVLHSKTATAATLECLGDFESLETLSLTTPELAINELPSLHKLKNLRSVTILSGKFSQHDATALKFLQAVPSLREIRFSSETVTDSTMGALGRISTLEKIELSRNSITDQGIAQLDNLQNLKVLRIWAAEKVTAACLPNILKHQALTEISLSGAPIHFEDAKVLGSLPNLNIRDVGMSHWEIAETRGQPHDDLEEFEDDAADGHSSNSADHS